MTDAVPDETTLAHDVSMAIVAATADGMPIEDAVRIVVEVAADYARLNLGAAHLETLAGVVSTRGAWTGETLRMVSKDAC